MQTRFSADQLADPEIAEANAILRSCVHCGFCTATCPTYVLLGDELDSPRGRIYLIKEMLEKDEPATAETAKHIDRCLSCLACMTTCPSGVNYMHLIDQARAHVEETYPRPLGDRMLRALLALVMPRPHLFRLSLIAAQMVKPFSALVGPRFAAMLNLVPARLPRPERLGPPGTYPAQGSKKGRVALLQGCVQRVLDPAINAATIRLLTRAGYEVVVTEGEGCCGSITLHMGDRQDALARARRSIDQWLAARVDHIIITASGCGTTIKDYGHLLHLNPAYAEKAEVISAKALDITQFLARIEMPEAQKSLRVAYHSACSMQHGQKIHAEPRELLRKAGFTVLEVPEGHLCCGSAGTYNILQPDIAKELKARKVKNLASTAPQLVATGNIGCITQLQNAIDVPVLHTVELLDWATGGPRPPAVPEELDESKD
jgi:glycolate oxidase iron-sulfur subunit